MDPRKLDIRIWYRGRSEPVWCYRSLPEGLVQARPSDLYMGRPVLYQVMVGPDTGCWYQDWVRPTTYQQLLERIRSGFPVYVKNKG